jgi:hypothetical protein
MNIKKINLLCPLNLVRFINIKRNPIFIIHYVKNNHYTWVKAKEENFKDLCDQILSNYLFSSIEETIEDATSYYGE